MKMKSDVSTSTDREEGPLLFKGEMVRGLLRAGKPAGLPHLCPKTQTRRIVSPRNSTVNGSPPGAMWDKLDFSRAVPRENTFLEVAVNGSIAQRDVHLRVPLRDDDLFWHRVRPNFPDVFWVKETFRLFTAGDCSCWEPCRCEIGKPIYKATCGFEREETDPPWKPSIFMRRHESRIDLEKTDVRVQRVQDISEADATAEGIEGDGDGHFKNYHDPQDDVNIGRMWMNARTSYATLWNSINLKPKAVGGKKVTHYEAYPWSLTDFVAVYKKISQGGAATPPHRMEWKGKPLVVYPNPWVWAITFRKM